MSERLTLAERVRVMQVIAVALVMGCAAFLAVVVFLPFERPAKEQGALPLITIMAGVMSVICLALRFIIPGIVVRNLTGRAASRTETPKSDDSLVAAYQTTLIVCMALIEGPAFMAAVAYLLEGHVAALVLAIALILVLAAHFPTLSRVEGWIKRQRERMDMESRRRDE
jgi:hypothetical protein